MKKEGHSTVNSDSSVHVENTRASPRYECDRIVQCNKVRDQDRLHLSWDGFLLLGGSLLLLRVAHHPESLAFYESKFSLEFWLMIFTLQQPLILWFFGTNFIKR
jgi:hypothetical protein